MMEAAKAMTGGVVRVENEDVFHALRSRRRVEPYLARERGLLRPAARGVDKRNARAAMLLESVLPNDFRLRKHAVRAECLRVNVIAEPFVERGPLVPFLRSRPVGCHHLPRKGEGHVRLVVVHRVIAEHKQRFTSARVGCVGLEVKRLLLARVFADLREVEKQFHALRLAEVVTRENLLCHFHAARDVANHAKLDVQMVEQPSRHFRVWNAAEDAKVPVVAARLFVVRQMLNHHALVLDGLHRLDVELVMLMHRANPFA